MEGVQAVKFKAGDRVKTKVDHESAWRHGYEAPAGSSGSVVGAHPRYNAYWVALDVDPDRMPVAYSKDELEAES